VVAEIGEKEVESFTGLPAIAWVLHNHPLSFTLNACPPDGERSIEIGGSWEWEAISRSKPEDISSTLNMIFSV
jgi:hypothetical protein